MTTQAIAIILAATLSCGLAACAPKPASTSGTAAPSKDPVTKPADSSASKTYTGVLRSGFVGIGGESTGWMLEGAELDKPIEVDISAVPALAHEWQGYKVRVIGTIITKKYVERGNVPILVATDSQPVI